MKNRRASVLWRCTWYMAQPGSLRECSVSFSKSAATSASCPTFAIQVTANTTIVSLLPGSTSGSPLGKTAGENILGFLPGRLQLRDELIEQNGVVTVRTGRNHANFRAGFLGHKRKILAGLTGQFFVVRDPFGRG